MFFAASFVVRIVCGLSLAAALGVAGYFIGGMLWPPSSGLSFLLVLLVSGAGIGAGIGGFLGWLRLEGGRSTMFTVLGLALVGGLAGAWGGAMYGRIVYEQALYSKAAQESTILGAAVAANTLPLIASIYWAWRYRRL